MSQDALLSTFLMQQCKNFAKDTVSRIYSFNPQRWEKYGEAGKRSCLRDAESHWTFLAEAAAEGDTTRFSDYAIWLRYLLDALHLQADTAMDVLSAMDLTAHELASPEQVRRIQDYLNVAATRLRNVPVECTTETDRNGANIKDMVTAFLATAPKPPKP